MNNELVLNEQQELIKNVKNFVLIDDQLKIINEKTKLLREKKGHISNYICNYMNNKNINKNIKISDGELKISEKKDYSPLSFSFVEKSLKEIISDDNKVNFIIEHLKNKREIKISSEIKRIKK